MARSGQNESDPQHCQQLKTASQAQSKAHQSIFNNAIRKFVKLGRGVQGLRFSEGLEGGGFLAMNPQIDITQYWQEK